MLEDTDQNINFQTMFQMEFGKSIKLPIEWYVTLYILRKIFFSFTVRRVGSLESSEIKGF